MITFIYSQVEAYKTILLLQVFSSLIAVLQLQAFEYGLLPGLTLSAIEQ